MHTTWTQHQRHKQTFESPVTDYSQSLHPHSHSNEYSEYVKKKHKKHKKKRKHESHARRSPNEEIPLEVEKKESVWCNGPSPLPAGYCFQNVDLHFNLNYNESIHIIPKSKYLALPTVMPKLKRVRLSNKSKTSELIAEPKWPNEDLIWLQSTKIKPVSSLRDAQLESLPTSEEIWSSHEAVKLGANPIWPLCCLPKETASKCESILRTENQISVSTQGCYKKQLELAVKSIANFTSCCRVARKNDTETSPAESKAHYLEFDSLELSLDEERGLLDFLKLKRLHAPLADIKSFETLLNMSRSEAGREQLSEILRTKLVEQLQLKAKYKPKEPAIRAKVTLAKETAIAQEKSIKVQESRVSPAKATEINHILNIVAVEELPKSTDLQTEQLQVQPAEQQLEEQVVVQLGIREEPSLDQPIIINVEQLPTVDVTAKPPDEAALQEWLKQLSQDLSRVVQSRFEAMPNANTETKPSELGVTTNKEVDFETQISQSEQPVLKSQLQTVAMQLNSAPNQTYLFNKPEQLQSSSQWEESYKSRLGAIDNVIKHSVPEFRDPLGKRLRNRCIAESGGQRTLDGMKRLIIMPALPSHLDQGLQQIRILRPPAKRKVERTSLQVETKVVRTYSTLQANRSLNLHMLSAKMENAVYNSEIEVIQKRYEGAQVAWIWLNGSILISNARSKAILAQTEQNLMSLLLGISYTPDLSQLNTLQTNLINITQFPWHICIEEFSQTYALSTETIQGGNRYAYYVSKSLPGVAAKVYESGAIHVYSMSITQADAMFEKLFLLTANHRKPCKVSPQRST